LSHLWKAFRKLLESNNSAAVFFIDFEEMAKGLLMAIYNDPLSANNFDPLKS